MCCWIEILTSECDKTTTFAFEYIEWVTWWFSLEMIFSLTIAFLHNSNIAYFWAKSIIIFFKIILSMLNNKFILRLSTTCALIQIWTSMRFSSRVTEKWSLNVMNSVLDLALSMSQMKIKDIELIFIVEFWDCRNFLLIKIIVLSQYDYELKFRSELNLKLNQNLKT